MRKTENITEAVVSMPVTCNFFHCDRIKDENLPYKHEGYWELERHQASQRKQNLIIFNERK